MLSQLFREKYCASFLNTYKLSKEEVYTQFRRRIIESNNSEQKLDANQHKQHPTASTEALNQSNNSDSNKTSETARVGKRNDLGHEGPYLHSFSPTECPVNDATNPPETTQGSVALFSSAPTHKHRPKSVARNGSNSKGRGSANTLLAQLRYKKVIVLLLIVSCISSASAEHVHSPCDPLLCCDASWIPSIGKADVLTQHNTTPCVPGITGSVFSGASTWPTSRAGLCQRPLLLDQACSCALGKDRCYLRSPAVNPPGISFYCCGVDRSNASLALHWSEDASRPLPHSGGICPLISLEFRFLLHSLMVLAICLYIKLWYPLRYNGEAAWEDLGPGRMDPRVFREPIQESFPPDPYYAMCVCGEGLSSSSFLYRLHHVHGDPPPDHGDSPPDHGDPPPDHGNRDDTVFPTSYSPPNPVEQDGNPSSVSADTELATLKVTKARKAKAEVQTQLGVIVAPKKAPRVVDSVVVVSTSQKQPTAVQKLGSIGKLSEEDDKDKSQTHVHTQDSSSNWNSKSLEGDEAVATVPSKITLDGHKANNFVSKLEVTKEPGVSPLCCPNPPPNTSGICMPPFCDALVTETGVGFMDVHGLGVQGCSMGPAFTNDELEFFPMVSAPQPMDAGYENEELFVCCFDRGVLQHFLAQYGPN